MKSDRSHSLRRICKRFYQPALGLLISGLTLYLALRNVDFADVWRSFAQARPFWMLAGLLSVAVNTLAKVYRWRILLGDLGKRAGMVRTTMALLAGQALNLVYPGRVGDVSRAFVMSPSGDGKVFTLGTILMEKILDTILYVILILGLFLLIPLPAWINSSAVWLSGVALILGILILLLVYQRTWLFAGINRLWAWLGPRFRVHWWGKIDRYLQAGMSSVQSFREEWPGLVSWSVVVWLTAILNDFLLLYALDLPLNDWYQRFLAATLTLVGLQFGISVPSVPARIGVFEYICVLALGFFGVDKAPAFTYGVLLHTVVQLPTTLLGFISIILLGLPGSKDKLAALSQHG